MGPPGDRNYSITHLLYMDDLKLYSADKDHLQAALNIVAEYTRDVGMSFGLDKCAVVHLARGKCSDTGDDVELVDGSVLRQLDAGELYRYLGMEEHRMHAVSEVRATLQSEYVRRLRKIWSSELSGKNKVSATNMLAVPVLLYSFGVLKWARKDLRDLDIKTRKIINMNRSMHPNSSVARLYLSRSIGGRGLQSLERLHDRLVLGLTHEVVNFTADEDDFLMQIVHKHENAHKGSFLYKAAIYAARTLGLGEINALMELRKEEFKSVIRNAEEKLLLGELMDKSMHSVFFKHVRDHGLSTQLTFSFLKSAGLMSETEGFIFACQDGVINTLEYRSKVLQVQLPDTSCRRCKQHPETLMHLLSACPVLARGAYIQRHNAALRVLYYYLRHCYGIDVTPVLPYLPGDIPQVVENDSCKIYWNMPFATTRRIDHNKPDIVLFDKATRDIY
ncbi:hypothetical protein FQP88_24255, partial [Vibrio atlanticus]